MKIKTSELTGAALDWAVAKCEGGTDFVFDGITWGFTLGGQQKVLAKGWAPSMSFCPSTNWAQGGPIIERELLLLRPYGLSWECSMGGINWLKGTTPLTAAVRAYAASKLGDAVDVPEELL